MENMIESNDIHQTNLLDLNSLNSSVIYQEGKL